MTLRLKLMTESEYAVWIDDAMAGYAEEFVASGILDAEDAVKRAETDFAALLLEGLATDNHLFWTAWVDAEPVGTIWVMLVPDRRPPHSFVYALDVHAAYRRRGYGRAIMEAAMQECRERGIATMGLNVFGHNDTARRLYERLGFRVASTSMITEL